MARKPGPGRCVHCLGPFEIRNWDHIFPKSWYPNSTPPNLEKWQIPTCKTCNSEYGRLEEDLFVMLAMTVDPDDEGAAGIWQRALRSVDESLGRDKRDRLARRARKKRVTDSLLMGEDIPDEGVYPGMGERWHRERRDQIAVVVPAEHVRRLCEKIVRGITFKERGILIEPPFSVDFFPLEEEAAVPIRALIEKHEERFARGPGFHVSMVVPADEPQAGALKITLFGQFIMYAFVSRAEG